MAAHKKTVHPGFEPNLPDVTQAAGSNQAGLRHTEEFAYCCFLPDLTGFTKFCCAGPNRQRCLPGSGSTKL